MDYSFTHSVTGKPIASFETDKQLFALWFTEELGNNREKLSSLLSEIEKLQAKKIHVFQMDGAEFSLYLDNDEVEIYRMACRADESIDLPEGTELDEQSETAGCGLADFKQVLLSWHQFVTS